MKKYLPSQKFIVRTVSLLIALAVILAVVPAVYAEGTGPLTPIPGLGKLPNETLIRMHQKEAGWVYDQVDLFNQAKKLSGAFQDLIDAEAAQGKNVTILQDALAIYDSELTASYQIHTRATEVIFSLAGWSNAGVRDRLAAGASLLDGRSFLKDANFRLTSAMAALRKGFVNWRASRIHGMPLQPTRTPKP
jgi:hypothetical protein